MCRLRRCFVPTATLSADLPVAGRMDTDDQAQIEMPAHAVFGFRTGVGILILAWSRPAGERSIR